MAKLNYKITGRCNNNCAFCSDTFQYQNDSSLEDTKKMLDRVSDFFDEIEITGGEPLLYPNIKEVLRYIKEKGIKTTLSTNGIDLTRQEEVLEYVDKIILPLDATDTDTLKNLGREERQLINIVKNIGIIRSKYPNIEVAVTTVLTKQNYQEIENLQGTVQLLGCDEWQIYQFLPHGIGKTNIIDFVMDDRIFDRVILSLQTSEISDKIEAFPVSKVINNEWIISPKFQVVKLKDFKTSNYGNIMEMSDNSIQNLFGTVPRKIMCKR